MGRGQVPDSVPQSRWSYPPDSGKTWAEAAAGANTGRLVWAVPEKLAAADCRLRIHAGKPGRSAVAVGGAFSIGPSQEVKDYEWVQIINKAAAFAPRDGAGALTFKGQDVAPRRLESRRQEALPAHLQQRGLEFRRRHRLDAGQAEHLPRPHVRPDEGLGGPAHRRLRRLSRTRCGSSAAT